MEYRPENQYRCTIIRGKCQSEMEDLLPFYAQVVHENCPCTKEEFDFRCNKQLSKFFFSDDDYNELTDANRKTIRNHITEIMGKLLGLYYVSADGEVYETESCNFLIEKNDFPAFFKNICLNFQFPNFADKIQTLKDRLINRINIRPMCYVVAFLDYSRKQAGSEVMTKQEIGYYILNNLDVLKGEVPVETVYDRIVSDRKNGIRRNRLSGSHDWQHIKEQFNLLELANIVETDEEHIWLNGEEEKAISIFVEMLRRPLFDFYKYNFDLKRDSEQAKIEWNEFFGKLNREILELDTNFIGVSQVIEFDKENIVGDVSTTELGDKGEALVYRIECERVKAFKERLVNKVLLLGKVKGLGYDISSIEADENSERPDFTRYIEVKSTIRISEPSFDYNWTDSLNLTSKEWIAAEQHGEHYNIYRVYFTKRKTIVVRVNNPFKKFVDGEIDVFPTVYRMNFSVNVIKMQYEEDV